MKFTGRLSFIIFVLGISNAAYAITNAQVFAFAEANYSSVFTETGTDGVYQQYSYRYYPASQNYLAVDTSGEIFVLGPFTGNAIISFGPVTNYASTITAWEASGAATTGQYRVVDTNQSSCYNSSTGAAIACSGTGYDADYSGNQPSYSASADGLTVLDNVTGLRWTQSTDINRSGAVDYDDKLYQSEAVSYCSNLTTGGYTWRLPNIKEAYSLILFSGKDASSYTGTDTSTLTPFIDSHFDWAFGDKTTAAGIAAGDRIIDAQYACTTLYVSTTMNGDSTMFGVNYVDGRIKGYPTVTKKYYVRCVTGNTSYGVNQFSDNGDQTISDSATGLMWQQNDSASTDWDNAVSICENSTTASHTDWRLPNVKELQSIVDYTRAPDTNNNAAIDPMFNSESVHQSCWC